MRVEEPLPIGIDMVEAEMIEVIAQSMCFVSLTAFIFIATFSENEKAELIAQELHYVLSFVNRSYSVVVIF